MENAFHRGLDRDDATIRGNQQIPTPQNLTARQHEGEVFTRYEGRAHTAFLPLLERQAEHTAHRELVSALPDFQFGTDLDHGGQNRK